MLMHGTRLIGSANPAAKFTEADALNIRARHAEVRVGRQRVPRGFWAPYVAVFDVSPRTLIYLVSRKNWTHI